MDDPTKVEYKCIVCGKRFEVDQGSRRRLCDPCLVRSVSEKKKAVDNGQGQ
jgi:DNA-directed RNA polymerase subunit RPC12/RpoP